MRPEQRIDVTALRTENPRVGGSIPSLATITSSNHNSLRPSDIKDTANRRSQS